MMTPELAELYERASVALEKHDKSVAKDPIAWKAWLQALDVVPEPDDHDAIDLEAARLLRECIANDRPLP